MTQTQNNIEQELEKELGFNIGEDGIIRASFDKHQMPITPHEAVLKLKAHCIFARREVEEQKRINERAYGMSKTELAMQGDKLAGKVATLEREVEELKERDKKLCDSQDYYIRQWKILEREVEKLKSQSLEFGMRAESAERETSLVRAQLNTNIDLLRKHNQSEADTIAKLEAALLEQTGWRVEAESRESLLKEENEQWLNDHRCWMEVRSVFDTKSIPATDSDILSMVHGLKAEVERLAKLTEAQERAQTNIINEMEDVKLTNDQLFAEIKDLRPPQEQMDKGEMK